MTNFFIKKEYHHPKIFILDAKKKMLGRLATKASLLLTGKYLTLHTPGSNQGNFVLILNSNQIEISGKKFFLKTYYKPTNRPGNLKFSTFKTKHLNSPTYALRTAINGMLPKNTLRKQYLKRLYIYSNLDLINKKDLNLSSLEAIWLN